MSDGKSLSHSVWDCKYHIVWIPKCRKKQLYGKAAKYLGEIFRQLARQRESKIVKGHLCPDHVHMLIQIPPKYAVLQVAGYIKGKSTIAIARNFMGKHKNFAGENFWARGYYVSTVGRDEERIKQYISKQKTEDKRLDQLELFKESKQP